MPWLGQSSRSEAFSWEVTAGKLIQMEVRNAFTSLDSSIRPLSSDILTLVLRKISTHCFDRAVPLGMFSVEQGVDFFTTILACFAFLIMLIIKFLLVAPRFPSPLE